MSYDVRKQGSEHKDMSDPSFSAADFRVQLTGGRLRWFASALAVGSAGFLGYLLTEGEKAELFFPFHIKGQAAYWTVGIAFVIWAAIAIMNWKAWLKKKSTGNKRFTTFSQGHDNWRGKLTEARWDETAIRLQQTHAPRNRQAGDVSP